jgi:tetratricopeptide (TPR) repeat protein
MKSIITITIILIALFTVSCDSNNSIKDGLSYDEYINIAKISLSDGNVDKAIIAYKKALQIRPDDAHVHFRLGEIYKDEWWRTYNLAQKKYQIDLLAQPDYEHANDHMKKLVEYGLKNEYKTLALKEFQETLKYDSRNWVAMFYIATAYKDDKLYKEAIDEYKKVIEINPSDVMSYNFMGESYMALGSYDQAIDSLRKAIKLDTNYEYSYYRLGKVYINMNDSEHAAAILRKLKSMNSSLYEDLMAYKSSGGR